jgi:hypothetical protein
MKEETQVQSHWTVDKTLTLIPETSRVFIKYQTRCVGCFLQKFCAIKDVAEIYQVNLDEFQKDLNECNIKTQN